MAEDFSKNTSKYNEAVLQIQRLHDSWIRCNTFARSGRFQEWRWELDVIWRELCSDIGKLNQKDKDNMIKLYNGTEEIKDIYGLNEHLANDIKSKTGRKFYDALDKRHIFLKHLQETVGKGGVFLDGTEDDFE